MKHGKTRLFALAAAHSASLLAVPVPFVLLLMPLNTVTMVLIGPLYGWSLLILFGLITCDTLRSRRRETDLTPLQANDEQRALAA